MDKGLSADTPQGALPAGDDAPLRVLVVDDSFENRVLLEEFVLILGHQAIPASDGREALRRFEADPPDLVLMDAMMPVLDGFATAREIRSRHPEPWVPIIFVTGLERDADLARCLEAGGDDFLVKPLSFPIFRAKLRLIQRIISLRRALDEARARLAALDTAPPAP